MARRSFRLAIILAAARRGDMLDAALRLARFYAGRDWPGLGRIDVVLGYPETPAPADDALHRACRTGDPAIALRRFRWVKLTPDEARLVFPPEAIPAGLAEVWLPDDGAREFRDADAWILVADHLRGTVPFLRPTAVASPDLAPRRIAALPGGPGGHGDRARLAETMTAWRQARCVFATTPAGCADLVSYAGIHPDRVLLAPPLLAPPQDAAALPSPGAEPGILWLADAAGADHDAAMAALRAYLAGGGGLRVTLCSEGSAPREVAPEVAQRLDLAGDPLPATRRRLMTARGIVWQPIPGEDAGLAAVAAARAGAHLVLGDDPPLRDLCAVHGIAARFHPVHDAARAAAELLEAERALGAGAPAGHALRATTAEALGQAYGRILARIATDA